MVSATCQLPLCLSNKYDEGVASFCVSLVQASRKKFTNPAPPHNVPLTIIGAFIIWGGWYSFNGGSALRANFQAVNALLNTQLSACTSLIVWTALGWYETRKYSVVTMASGALAGLAGNYFLTAF